jgi:CRISPR/Cas system CSM-associated protein Csm4 (group 5 of RAMP superfamily)
MNSLKMHNLKDNCELAFEVAELVGVETSLLVEDLTDTSVPDKTAVMLFLRELQVILSKPERVVVPPDTVTEFQTKWFRRSGYFSKDVEHLVQAEEDEANRVIEEKKSAEENQKKVEAEKEKRRLQEEEEVKAPGRDRVRQMIAAAHREASIESESSDDVMIVGRSMRESKTISEEMSKLVNEEER